VVRLRLGAAIVFAFLVPFFTLAAEKPAVIDLWPGVVPGEKGDVGEEKITMGKTGEATVIKSITNVSKPTLTIYKPAKTINTGAAIVVAPGGGYNNLAWEHEGTMVGDWLQSIGVTGVILKYRVPRRADSPMGPPIGALQDAQRAISVTRSNAAAWGIDPKRIGMLGFSAGGHLTAWTLSKFGEPSYPAIDDVDKVSNRPDFAVLIYPGGLVHRTEKDKLAPELAFSKQTPPCFFALAYNDNGPLDGSLKMMAELKKVGVSAELHVYSAGGHGFGMRPGDKPHQTWPKRCEEWLNAEGFLVTAKASEGVPTAPGSKIEKLADGFSFTEGPSSDKDGNVYFTDQPNDRILKWSTDGKLSTFMEKCGRSNGLCFDKDGKLWACADEKNELWVIDVATKVKTVVVKDFNGKLLNGPNDLWIRPDGGVYFTDPFYKRPYWARGPQEQDKKAAYFYSAAGKLSRVDDDYTMPNGIVGTPDGKTLYVADIGKSKTYQYEIQADGTLKNRKLFCELGSDGMTLDTEGNVYLTGKGVIAFDKSGQKLGTIEVPESWTANVCFGGADQKTLFITAGKGFYAIKMKFAGASRQ